MNLAGDILTASVALLGSALGLPQPGLSGEFGRNVEAVPSSAPAFWLSADLADGNEGGDCVVGPPRRWTCPSVSPGSRGVVMMLTTDGIRYVLVGPGGVLATGGGAWGRLVRVTPGGVASDDLDDLKLSIWRPDRLSIRPRTRKLGLVQDSAVDVQQLSKTSFWISGAVVPSSESLLRLEGAKIASRQMPLTALASGPPTSSFDLDAAVPLAIGGLVEGRPGEAARRAQVEVLVAIGEDDSAVGSARSGDDPVLVRIATTETDDEGRFEVAGLEAGRYLIAVTSFTEGRAEVWTTSADPPLLVKLVPPVTVRGRVLRRGLPAGHVRVRFVPDASAWRASADPSAHLAAETSTDELGRFTLALPPVPIGALQFIAPDGTSARVSVPRLEDTTDVAAGDVALPDLIAVEVRTDIQGCQVSALGPIGGLGLVTVRAQSSANLHWLELPEAGQWFLDAECAGRHRTLVPAAISVSGASPPTGVDARVTP